MQQPAALARREHRDRIGRARRAQICSLQRIDRNIHRRKIRFRRVRGQPHLLSDVQHRRFIAFAFADHDGAVHLQAVHRFAHRLHRHFIRLVTIAKTHRARCCNCRVFYHSQEFQAQLSFHRSLRNFAVLPLCISF